MAASLRFVALYLGRYGRENCGRSLAAAAEGGAVLVGAAPRRSGARQAPPPSRCRLPHRACAVLYEPRRAATTGTTGSVAMSEQSERTQSPASLKAYQQDLERAAMLHPLSAACLQLWDTLLCEVVDETVSAYAQAHAARPTPLPPASQELLEGWTPEQTRAAAASSAVRDVLELEASALRARKPSQAATAQLEDVFGNRPKQGADTIVCINCKSEVSSNRCARMPKATDPRYPEAPATSPSGLDTPRQRHESQRRAASRRSASLGHLAGGFRRAGLNTVPPLLSTS